MSGTIQTLADYISDTTYEDLPEDIIHATKYLLLDSLGCALASVTTDRGKMSIALARKMGGPKESTIIGIGDKVSCVTASFANGELINSADYDALMPGGHLPPYVIPPAMAVAESRRSSGKDLILALALGFEIAARIPNGIVMQRFIGKGKEAKFSWGKRWGQAWSNFGATAGAAKLLHLDKDAMEDALGISGHLCQVLTHVRYSFSDNRPLTKYGVPGWQNTGGIMAAMMAEMGYSGDRTVFDGDYGFFHFCGYEGEIDLQGITKDIGKTWNFKKIIYKPYPCCRMLQGGIDCLVRIMDENQIRPEEIESVRVLGHPTIELPCFLHPEVNNVVDAQFNAAYVYAVVACGIPIGPGWQDKATMQNTFVREMMNKIQFGGHPEFISKVQENASNQLFSVELTARGQSFHAETLHPRGVAGREGEMTGVELEAKFIKNADRILTRKKIDKAIEILLHLENLDKPARLMDAISI